MFSLVLCVSSPLSPDFVAIIARALVLYMIGLEIDSPEETEPQGRAPQYQKASDPHFPQDTPALNIPSADVDAEVVVPLQLQLEDEPVQSTVWAVCMYVCIYTHTCICIYNDVAIEILS